ncbi:MULTISPECIES: hypothetical protein [Lactobacillaceae]|uniref:hypothetical protein n=1 Tax=Lactobacillaceae TaxID=33958 RepID=UPI0007C43A49|nr:MULTISPECIES: hypothetical protein [Lactobacillaceae]MCT1175232.1 hypothetical protein [Pediococcus pentosaceus]
MKKSRLKIIAYVVIVEILFIGIVDPTLSIFISTNLNSRIVSGTLVFTMLIVAGELYTLLFRKNKATGKKHRKSKEHVIADQKKQDRSFEHELADSLTKEFNFTIDELKAGKKSRFDLRDIDVVTEYLQLKIGGSISGGYNGAQSLAFKTEKGYILLDIVESQLKTFLDNKKHYEVWFNDQQIYDLSEVVLTK